METGRCSLGEIKWICLRRYSRTGLSVSQTASVAVCVCVCAIKMGWENAPLPQ